LLRWILMRM